MQGQELKEANEIPKKKKDRFLSFIICQIAICFFIIVFSFVLKVVGGDTFEYATDMFNEYFNKPINVNQVLNAAQTRQVLAIQSTVYSSKNINLKTKSASKTNLDTATQEATSKTSDFNSMCIPVSGKVTSKFSYRIHPISGEYLFHSGIDIGADYGDDIKSALDGEVSETDTEGLTGYGKYIVVSHSSGASTLYGHCSEIIAKVGDKVKKGEVIAKVGSTGVSTGPHLHFEVRVNGVKLDPQNFADFV